MLDLRSALHANEHIIPSIYETAVDPTTWNEVLEKTSEFLGAVSGMHSLSFWASGRGKCLSEHGMLEGAMDHWEKNFATNDWVRTAATLPAGQVMHTELPSMEVMLETRLGREILAPQGWKDLMAVRTTDSNLFLGALSFYAKTMIEPEMVERFEFLIPHFARALALHQRIARLSLDAAAFESGIEQVPAAVFLLGSAGDVLHRNVAAAAMLEEADGLSELNGKLLLPTPAIRNDLQLAIAQALAPDPEEAGRGLFRIQRPSGATPYYGVVSPVTPRLANPGTADAVFLWVTDPDRPIVPDTETISVLLGLTPAESRVAAAIARGGSIKEYASEAGLQEGSVRWTLKQVLAKSGARNQADLVRIILHSVPSPPF